MNQFQRQLLDWYSENKRDLPWRGTHDPYVVLVSEFMLQQTTVATVIPYFKKWLVNFPDWKTLANADPGDVLANWAGLGYYNRCRNLQRSAKLIVAHGIPETFEEWGKLPGIGPYTAAAVSSIAQGIAVHLVDGNVERVYARYEADPSTKPALARHAKTWSEKMLVSLVPGEWNQALMELGATVCKPLNPDCRVCPINLTCKALAQGRPTDYPTKPNKSELLLLNHTVVIPVYRGQLGCLQTGDGKWWAGMWGFPRFENVNDMRKCFDPKTFTKIGSFKHMVTKHRIEVDVFVTVLQSQLPQYSWFALEQLNSLGFPSPQKKALSILLQSSFIGSHL